MPASWEAGKFFSCYGCRTPMPGSPFTGGGKENLCPFPWGGRRLFSPRAHPHARFTAHWGTEKPLPLTLGEPAPFLTADAPPCRARRLPEAGKKIFAPSLGEAGAFSHRGRTPRPGSPFTGDGKENLCLFPWGGRRLFSPRAHPHARLAVYRRRERKPLPLPLGKPAPFLTAGAPPGRARRSPGAAGCSCTGAGRRACKSTRISPRRCRTQ